MNIYYIVKVIYVKDVRKYLVYCEGFPSIHVQSLAEDKYKRIPNKIIEELS